MEVNRLISLNFCSQ